METGTGQRYVTWDKGADPFVSDPVEPPTKVLDLTSKTNAELKTILKNMNQETTGNKACTISVYLSMTVMLLQVELQLRVLHPVGNLQRLPLTEEEKQR